VTIDVRIDGQYVASAAPADPGLDPATPSATPGFFQPGDPTAGHPATRLKFWWFNWVQESLRKVITQAGLTPDRSSFTQLYTAITTLIGNAITALSLGTASTKAVAFFLQTGNALSELTSVAVTARSNLGLGTAATHAAGDFDASGAASSAQTAAQTYALTAANNAQTNAQTYAAGVAGAAQSTAQAYALGLFANTGFLLNVKPFILTASFSDSISLSATAPHAGIYIAFSTLNFATPAAVGSSTTAALAITGAATQSDATQMTSVQFNGIAVSAGASVTATLSVSTGGTSPATTATGRLAMIFIPTN
jgi:hypothetical protein